MNTITETTEAVETLALVPDSFCDADFYTRMQGKGLALREVVPVKLFVQSEQDSPMESARLPDVG